MSSSSRTGRAECAATACPAMKDLPGMERPNRYKRPARINLTDKDARLMRTRQGIAPSYNAQAMVSPVATDEGVTGMLVTASDVVDEPNDTGRLTVMTKQAEEVTGVRVPMTLADAGYFAGKHVAELHRRGQQVLMPDKASPTNHPYHWTSSDTMRIPTATPVLMDSPCLSGSEQQEKESAKVSGSLSVGVPGMSGFRSLHQERFGRTYSGDWTLRRGAASSQELDGDR